MSQFRSPLGRYAGAMRDPDPEAAWKAARDTYTRTQGETVLINKKWLCNWADRKQLDLLAEKALDLKGFE